MNENQLAMHELIKELANLEEDEDNEDDN